MLGIGGFFLLNSCAPLDFFVNMCYNETKNF